MNETPRTLAFVAAAAVALLSAWLVQPRPPSTDPSNDVGQLFFPDFKDPLVAAQLEVLDFDEKTGDQRSFKVRKLDTGAWVIPSHHNYPADGSNRMADAAAAVIGVQKLSIESDEASTHVEFGVKDPEKAQEGDAGVGSLVRLADAAGNALVRLIVGKEVAGREGVRYVRVPSQDRVYTARVDPSKLTTRFTDWVERDFLDLNAWNIRRVSLDGHSIDEARGRLVPGEVLDLTYNSSATPQWKLAGTPLTPGQELDADKLNALRNAFDDLQIVNVDRKPTLLSENLRKGQELMKDLTDPKNEEVVRSLQEKGFFPVVIATPTGNVPKVFSNQGQVFVGMDDGVEYVLRFGEVVEDDAPAADAPKDAAPKDAAKDPAARKPGDKASTDPQPADKPVKDPKATDKPKGQNRHIYVVAQVNADLIEKPKLDPVPAVPSLDEIKRELAKAAAGPDSALPTPETKAETKPEAKPETKPEPKAETKPEAKPEATPDTKPETTKPTEKSAEKQPEKPADKPAEPKGPQGAQGAAGEKPADAAPSPAPAPAPALTPEQQLEQRAQDELKRRQEAADRVTKDNDLKQKDYDEKIKRAQERVDKLNGRFADWYYVISDEVYRKIKLGRSDIIKKKNQDALNKEASQKFLDENKAKPGVTVTPSGLQYEVLQPGAGAKPGPNSDVSVRYKGTLIDGTVFDQSGEQPASFNAGGVIRGWTEALQLMPLGAKYKLYIPSDLAYGEAGSPPKIGPNQALIFEVELLSIK